MTLYFGGVRFCWGTIFVLSTGEMHLSVAPKADE